MWIVNCGYNYHHPKEFQINRPHGSGDYILLIVRSPATFTIDKKTYFTNGNAVIIFNKGTPQLYGSSDKEYVNDWVHFECDEDDIKLFKELEIEFDKILEFQSVTELSSLIKLIYFEKYSNNKNSTLTVTTLFKLIMLKISDFCQQNQTTDSKLQIQLNNLRNSIFSNPQKNWQLEEISKSLSISKSYLQHKYKLFFNTCIKGDITLSRIEHSKYLLFSTNYTITTISALCGYENDVHFMRTFKKNTGLTPTEYRKSLNHSQTLVEEAKSRNPFSL